MDILLGAGAGSEPRCFPGDRAGADSNQYDSALLVLMVSSVTFCLGSIFCECFDAWGRHQINSLRQRVGLASQSCCGLEPGTHSFLFRPDNYPDLTSLLVMASNILINTSVSSECSRKLAFSLTLLRTCDSKRLPGIARCLENICQDKCNKNEPCGMVHNY